MELFIFSQDEQPLTVLSADTGLVEASYRIEVNSVPTEPFIFTVKASHPIAEYVVEENKVVFKDHEGDWRFMVIKDLKDKTDQEGRQTTAICFPVYTAELNDHVIEERRFIDQIVDVAMNAAVQGTRWEAVVEVELGRATTNFYRIYSTEAFEEIINTWGGELKDVVDFDEVTNKIKGCYMKLIQRHGTEHGQRFEIGHNTVEIYRRILSYPKTALFGYGSSLEVEGEDGEHTGGYTRYIDFGDVEWRTSRGDPVNKPLGQKWIGDPGALAIYGYENGDKHRYGIFSNQDYEDPADLLQATWEALQKAKIPEVNYRLSVELFDEKVSLGDTCQAIDRKFARPIEIQARVIAMEYDLLDIEGTMVVEMGQFLDLGADRISDLEKEVENIKNRPPKQIIDEGNYPDIKPGTPVNVEAHGGMEVIQLYWDYASQIYIKHYEVYGSRTEDFVPDSQHLLWRGNTSAFAHTVGTDEVWYYRVRAVNYHGTPSDWSEQVRGATHRVISDDILFGPELAERMRELHRISDIIGENGVNFYQISQEAKDLINQQAKIYTDEEIQATREDVMRNISDISDDLEYVEGRLIDKVNVGDVYTIADIDGMFDNTVSITRYETDMDGVVQDLEHHETVISQNELEILNRVTETIFNEETGYLRQSIADVVIQADRIEQTVSNIRIGGRNLIEGSSVPYTFTSNSSDFNYYIIYRGLERNTTYTFSAKVEVLTGAVTEITVYPYLRSGENMPTITVPIVNGRITATFTTDNRYDYNLLVYNGRYGSTAGNQVRLTEYQLEKGNKATDWSPAPEDMDNRMTNAESSIVQLAEDITLKVNVDEIVSEINVNREGIRLSGALIHLNGLSLIDETIIQTAHIADGAIQRAKLGTAVVGTLQVEDGAITNAKIGSLNVDKLYGSRIQGIDIEGARFYSTSGNNWMEIIGGDMRLRQANGSYVDISPIGMYGYNSSGSLRFQSDLSLTTSAAFGTVNTNVYLGSFAETRSVTYNSIGGDGAIDSYVYTDVRAKHFYGNVLEANWGVNNATNVYLRPRAGGEIRVTAGQTIDTYLDLRARGLYTTYLDKNLNHGSGDSIYVRPASNGELRITRIGTIDRYLDIRAYGLKINAIDFNTDASTGSNLYVRTVAGGELRFTINGGTSTYVDIRSRYAYTNVVEINALHGSSPDLFLRPGGTGEARVTAAGRTDAYRPIRADSFPTGSSEKIKENIVKYNENALDIINKSVIYEYNRKATGVKEIGFIIEREIPDIVLFDEESVNGYSHRSLNTKAIQELDSKLTNEINWQRIEYQLLKNKVTELEEEVQELKEMIA